MYRVTNIAWLKIPTGRRQISWLFTKWSDRGLWITRPTPLPLDHAVSRATKELYGLKFVITVRALWTPVTLSCFQSGGTDKCTARPPTRMLECYLISSFKVQACIQILLFQRKRFACKVFSCFCFWANLNINYFTDMEALE